MDYPTPELSPKDGFTVDRALVYAITYQESRFNPDVVSPAGAIGLMQLKLATAQGVGYRGDADGPAEGVQRVEESAARSHGLGRRQRVADRRQRGSQEEGRRPDCERDQCHLCDQSPGSESPRLRTTSGRVGRSGRAAFARSIWS